MDCKQSKPKRGTQGRPTRPAGNISNAPQVSHRPPPQQQKRRPQQPRQQQQQQYEPVAQHHHAQVYHNDDNMYDASASSHQQHQYKHTTQKENPYANDQRYVQGRIAAEAAGKLAARGVLSRVPNGEKYEGYVNKGIEKGAGVVVMEGMKWNDKRAQDKAQRQQQGGPSQRQAAMGEQKY